MPATTTPAPDPVPLPTRLGWKLDRELLMYTDAKQPDVGNEQIIRFLPSMPWLEPADTEVVLDLVQLLYSAKTPGGYDVLTSSCGYGPDAEINECVYVSHPGADLIVWYLDWEKYDIHIHPDMPRCGRGLELHFERAQYEADLFAMWREVEAADLDLQVYELQPAGWHQFEPLRPALQHLSRLPLVPVLPPGSLLEFGFVGDECYFINAQHGGSWPTRLLPDGRTRDAFETWMTFVKRGWTLIPDPNLKNDFFLLHEEDRDACEGAGRRLVACLRQAWSASVPPQAIEVRLLPCDLVTVPCKPAHAQRADSSP